jgi:hypothetical protein
MKIELKNFKHYDRLSEETLCFVGNIWVNGVKCGYAENSGKGGCASYHHEGTTTSRDLIREAEKYCESNKTNLWDFLDHLACEIATKKEKEAIAKKMNKEMQKAILIGIDNGSEIAYQTITFKLPLRDMWEKHPDFFKKTLIEKLDKYQAKGYRLLNTNIPQQFITN